MADGVRLIVVGGGGREHALAWKLAQSPHVEKVYVLPGNPGMTWPWDSSQAAQKIACVPVAADDIPGIISFAKNEGVGLIVPGPELPLVRGIADAGREADIPVFGPDERAAMATEGSKCEAKEFMARHNIPTARFRNFKPGEEADLEACLRAHPLPVVVKDDELAGGKGVTIANGDDAARNAALGLLKRGHRLVVEDYLPGEELTFTCIVAGEEFLPLAIARDRKIFKGKMTGGMAALCHDGLADEALFAKIVDRIVKPTVQGLAREGIHYLGFLYFGLMVVDGEPYLLEYNCRLGDPEAQAILIRFWNDLYCVIRAALAGHLASVALVWDPNAALVLVMAAAGYPGDPRKGDCIQGLQRAECYRDAKIFYAGVAEENGKLLTVGGRVLGLTATAVTPGLAETLAYRAVRKIRWPGHQYLSRLGYIPAAVGVQPRR